MPPIITINIFSDNLVEGRANELDQSPSGSLKISGEVAAHGGNQVPLRKYHKIDVSKLEINRGYSPAND